MVNPWTWQDRLGYVQVNEISGTERVLACSGQTSLLVEMRPSLPVATVAHVRRSDAEPGVQSLATIGVYGFTAERFLDRLRGADVGRLLDVRQRRGVRGSDYAWANSVRLQAALAQADIEYRHHKELAPTTELRQLQYREDDRRGVGKRSRTQLADEYRERYVAEILDQADLAAVVAEFPTQRRAALLCVEGDSEACHRSLIAERLAADYGIEVTHLGPG